MQMSRAFNARMMVSVDILPKAVGSYNDDNDWIPGTSIAYIIKAVVCAAKGKDVHNQEGGIHISNYKRMTFNHNKFSASIGDVVVYRGLRYNILKSIDHSHHGFKQFLIEEAKQQD